MSYTGHKGAGIRPSGVTPTLTGHKGAGTRRAGPAQNMRDIINMMKEKGLLQAKKKMPC